jgi:dipeptidyl aminopeptidase/acylaminoacyl peptidase
MSMIRNWVVALSCFPLVVPAFGQQVDLAKEAYLQPPKEIADAVLSSRNDNFTLTNISPDGKKFLIARSDGMPTLQRMGRPYVYLAEMAFDEGACRARDLWIRSNTGFDIFYYANKRMVPVQVPDGTRVSNPVWSPDGSMVAFYAHFEDATHIYIADTETGYSRRLTVTPVMATLVTAFQWSKDGKHIETVLLPDDGRRGMPKPGSLATEPKVRVARGGNHPSRTYRYLLESPYDMKLLEYLGTGQLALIDVNDGRVTKVGFPNLIRSVSMSPAENEFRVTTMKKPFSYYVPLSNFGSLEGIWNREGKSLYTLNDRSLRDNDLQGQPPVTPTVVAANQSQTLDQVRTGRPRQAPTQTAPATDPDPNADPNIPQRPADPDAKRAMEWRPDGAGLSFLQLEPAKTKDPKEVRKDRVCQWLAPYGKDDVKVMYETPQRIASVQYSEDCKTLFLTQTIDNQRQISAVDLADPKKTVYVVFKDAPRGGVNPAGRGANPPAGAAIDPSLDAADDEPVDDQDEEQVPGRGTGFRGRGGPGGGPSLMTVTSRGSASVVRVSSTGEVYISNTSRPVPSDKSFPKPSIDKINIKTGKKDRIFEGKGETLETIDAVNGNDVKVVFTTRQKADVVPDSYMTELPSGKVTKLTSNVNHAPWFNQLQVQRFRVTRVDGFKFWVKITTPAKATGKLPALFWIYPREYTDQAAYDRGNRDMTQANRFLTPAPRSMTILTLLGYAVVEPDVPIVGVAGRMNDNYVPDLRNSLWAAIDECDKRGLIDRDRLAIGGHSYGAFSTANALAHTPFFRAGIAGDGNYNRTLTSMTFQTERRHIWDARETYLEMSPVLWANRVNGALLMYHGRDDANTGTHPINAEHLFLALDGLGKPAALYMYPYEGHGPLALETTMDQWARWVAWLDKYVKNSKGEKRT